MFDYQLNNKLSVLDSLFYFFLILTNVPVILKNRYVKKTIIM